MGLLWGGLGTVMYQYSCKQTRRNELNWIEFAGLGGASEAVQASTVPVSYPVWRWVGFQDDQRDAGVDDKGRSGLPDFYAL